MNKLILMVAFFASVAAAQDLKLWYEKPAAEWVEALPVGNGRLGAMVFGGTENERIQLNEGTLWAGGPYDPSFSGGSRSITRGAAADLRGQVP